MERWQKPEGEYNAQGAAGDHPSRSSLDYTTPLRSVRGDATSAPSPFYKLSAELSRESLRIPGAVPFVWEQSPGRRKFTASSPPSVISPHGVSMKPQGGSFMPESTNTSVVDPPKKNLATLFRQPSLKGVVAGVPAAPDSWCDPPISSAMPQISPPPAADHPRSSSARYSIFTQRNMPPAFNNAGLQIDNGDDDDAVSDEAISDALTATAGEGLSMDDSLVPSGALRPAITPSEARDFIMHRFLPAAHTIACELPQTPSRRFLPVVGVSAASCSPSTPSRCNGSFRDYGAASRPSPLRYVSAPSTPASNARQLQPKGQLHAGSFHGEDEEEEEEEEDVEEDRPFTPKVCGIFPFRITLSFHNRHTTEESSRRSPSSKHQHNKQQHQKKGSKLMNYASSPMRIMDILHDDHSSSHDEDSPVHRLRNKQLEAERERTKFAVLERAGFLQASTDPRIKPPFNSYYRGSPNLHQLFTAQHAASEEASESGSYQDAPSRFNSPSPAAFHLNVRALKAYNMQPPLVNCTSQTSRSFAGLQDDHASAAIISTTEQHLLNSSFCYYNMHSSINKPHYQPQLASPSTYHTPLSSHVGASHQSCAYDDNISNDISSKGSYHDTTSIKASEKANYHDITTNAEPWDASNHLAQKTHIINNALYEPEDQETNMIVNRNSPGMFTTISEDVPTYTPNWTRLNQGTAFNQRGPGGGHGYGESNINGDHYVSNNGYNYVSRGDQCESERESYNVSNGNHHLSIGNFHSSGGNHHIMMNGDLHGGKGHPHVSNGNHYMSNGSHQGDHYVSNNLHYASKDQYVSNGGIYASNGEVHGKINSSLPSKSLLSPPLPKSPTHSWLDRAMPLVTASTNKSLGTSSRLSHMRKATPEDDYAYNVSMSKTRKQGHPISTEASKWEALVKGSHLQPGHLRFSEELYQQSQPITKVGAS